MSAFDSSEECRFEVKLDGVLVEIPPDRQTFEAIHSYLELLALQRQRIICLLAVDENPVNLTHPRPVAESFLLIEAETMGLNEVPLRLISAALQQTTTLRARVQATAELVLINSIEQARELWWNISVSFKEPLLTLSLLPESSCPPAPGRASLTQLRKWQLEQLSRIIQEVDNAGNSSDPIRLSDALEARALPWLDQLIESLQLWQETLNLASSDTEQKSLLF